MRVLGLIIPMIGVRRRIKNDLAGVISLQIDYHLSTNLRFNRVVSFNHKDQDMFMVGIGWNF
ncbi:MAG: hypothetical protein AB8V22_06145 [Arsenophonus endosymbiont of Dermacentor nuttalli]